MSTQEYRGTGMTKEQCQELVDAAIDRWKEEHPGEPVPSSLTNWVDNIATDEDVAMARQRIAMR